MNQRIKQLEQQCWSHRVEGALVDGQLHFDRRKFAELIVGECIDVVEDAGGIDKYHYARAIEKHFGDEE